MNKEKNIQNVINFNQLISEQVEVNQQKTETSSDRNLAVITKYIHTQNSKKEETVYLSQYIVFFILAILAILFFKIHDMTGFSMIISFLCGLGLMIKAAVTFKNFRDQNSK